MIIRPAETKDIDAVRSLIMAFHQESFGKYGFTITDETINATIKNFINGFVNFLAEKDNRVVGVVAGIIMPSIFDKSQSIAQEMIWFVDKKERGGTIGFKLLKAFEDECKNRGANVIIMASMNGGNADILDRYYTKRGYQMLENHYILGGL